MSHVEGRHRNRSHVPTLMEAAMLGVMLVGTLMAALILLGTVGWALGIFAF